MYSILPRLESYYELVNRRIHGDMDSERARKLVLDITQDELEAERIAAEVTFATTPLK